MLLYKGAHPKFNDGILGIFCLKDIYIYIICYLLYFSLKLQLGHPNNQPNMAPF